MTEAEWLACAEPEKMLLVLQGKASDRKLRLFAVACCCRHWNLLPDGESRNVVETAERFADGNISEAELHATWVTAWNAGMVPVREGTWTPGEQAARQVARDAAANSAYEAAIEVAHAAGSQRECQLLHCIFGPIPFRPIALNPAWLTATVKQLAEGIYEERAFDRMPILGDTLKESGCSNADILNHCRQPGEHSRGCWVVDLLLGKE